MAVENPQNTFVSNFNADSQQAEDVKLMTDEQGHLFPLSQIVEGATLGDSFKVSASNPTSMAVNIEPGYIQIPFDNYAYQCWMTGRLSFNVDASSQSLSRWSYIVAYIDRGKQYDESVTNNPGLLVIDEVKGTPAANPALPSTQQIINKVHAGNPYVILASVYVPATSSTVTPGAITDYRTQLNLKKGISLPVGVSAGSLYRAGTTEESAKTATPLKVAVIGASDPYPTTDNTADIIVIRLLG